MRSDRRDFQRSLVTFLVHFRLSPFTPTPTLKQPWYLIYSIFLGGQDERTPVFRGSHISWGNMIEFFCIPLLYFSFTMLPSGLALMNFRLRFSFRLFGGLAYFPACFQRLTLDSAWRLAVCRFTFDCQRGGNLTHKFTRVMQVSEFSTCRTVFSTSKFLFDSWFRSTFRPQPTRVEIAFSKTKTITV